MGSFSDSVKVTAGYARNEGVSVGDAMTELAEAMASIAPAPIPGIGPLDEYGSHTVDGFDQSVRFFSVLGLKLATTQQQIGNIRVQCGCDEAGNFKPAGPWPLGWVKNQVVNIFMLPILVLAGVGTNGAPQWTPLAKNPYRFVRLRLRTVEEIQKTVTNLDLP